MSVYKVFLPLAMAMVVSAIDSNWYDAHATCYGDMGGGETMRKLKSLGKEKVGRALP